IRNAKPTGSVKKLSDGKGLQLWLMPTGSKLWRLDYRFEGKRKLLALGAYPSLSLAVARQRREEMKTVLASGRDPAVASKLAKLAKKAASANTFAALAGEYV